MLLRVPEEQQGFQQGEGTLPDGIVDKGHGTSVRKRKGGKIPQRSVNCGLRYEWGTSRDKGAFEVKLQISR